MNQVRSIPRARRRSSRDAVERAARELFVEKGFEGASVDEIARRARVSKPTIYAHFGGKEGLFVHILETACNRLLAPIVEADAENRPVREVLIDLAYAYTRTVLAKEVLSLHRLFIAEAERFPALGRRYFQAGPHTAHLGLAAFLEKRSNAGELLCDDPLMAAEQFAGIVLSPIRLKLLFAAQAEPDWDTVDRYSESAVSIFLSGLATREGDRKTRRSRITATARGLVSSQTEGNS